MVDGWYNMIGWQEIAVAVLILFALAYLVRFIYRSIRSADCSSCPSCETKDLVNKQRAR